MEQGKKRENQKKNNKKDINGKVQIHYKSRPPLQIAQLFIEEFHDQEHGLNYMGFPTYLTMTSQPNMKPARKLCSVC